MSNLEQEQRTSEVITGLFEKQTELKGKFYVGGRLNQENLDRIAKFAEAFGGFENIEINLEKNRNPKSEKSPSHFLVVKKKFVPNKNYSPF